MPDDINSDIVSNSQSPENSDILNTQFSGSSSDNTENNGKISAQITNIASSLLTSTKQLNQVKTDVKTLSTNVNNIEKDITTVKTQLKTVTNQTEKISNLNEIVRAIKKFNNNSQKILKSDEQVDIKTKTSKKESDVELVEKIKIVLAAVLPKALKASKKDEYKSNSKIDETVQPVTVKSFSALANQQLVNNIKQALQIKKQQDSMVSKSNLIKIAILAFVGIIIYLLVKLKDIKDAITEQIQNIKDGFTSIVETITNWFADMKNSFMDSIYNPIVSKINEFTALVIDIYTEWKTKLEEMMPTNLQEFISSVKTAIISVKNFFTTDLFKLAQNLLPALKQFINTFLGFDFFKKEETLPVDEEPEETLKDEEDTISGGNLGSMSNQINSKKDTPGKAQLLNENNNINNNNATKIENDNIVNVAGTKLAQQLSNTLILQNGEMIKLNKQDDIYIANKPDGVIANIFREINANYSKTYTKLANHFDSILDNIQEQDKQLASMCDNIGNLKSNTQSEQFKVALIQLQQQISALQTASTQPTVYSGVDIVRRQVRRCFNM
jgi:outer membrane murein-binding lipoprotein Lpp